MPSEGAACTVACHITVLPQLANGAARQGVVLEVHCKDGAWHAGACVRVCLCVRVRVCVCCELS